MKPFASDICVHNGFQCRFSTKVNAYRNAGSAKMRFGQLRSSSIPFILVLARHVVAHSPDSLKRETISH
jgi:hypothetical protein